jgi:hypothetical protein
LANAIRSGAFVMVTRNFFVEMMTVLPGRTIALVFGHSVFAMAYEKSAPKSLA